MVRVKVCGITRDDDLRVATAAGADAVGFITDVPVDTPREIDPERAAALVADAPPFLTTTLVLMPDSPDHAVELTRTVRPDVAQLHGSFSPDELRYIRAETGTKLVTVVDCDETERAHEYGRVADAVLVDSTTEDGAGGTGETHDWERTEALTRDLSVPVILAGGLSPSNVAEAVRTVDPFAVDVASGVEATGGVKDPDAVETFVANATRDPSEVPL